MPENWTEITESEYWYYLEVLPPIYGPDGIFAVSEALYHNDQGQAVYTICKEDRSAQRYYKTQGTAQQMLRRLL